MNTLPGDACAGQAGGIKKRRLTQKATPNELVRGDFDADADASLREVTLVFADADASSCAATRSALEVRLTCRKD